MTRGVDDEIYRQWFEKSPLGIFFVDEAGANIDVNPKAVEMTGYAEDDLCSMSFDELFVEMDGRTLEDVFEDVEESGAEQIEGQFEHAHGDRLDGRLDVEKADDGGFIVFLREFPEIKQRKYPDKDPKDRLEFAIQAANLGVWDWNIQTDEVRFNDQWTQMLGLSPEEVEQTLQAWENRVHPDDIDEVESAIEAHLSGETAYYETEHRLQTAAGNYIWVRDIGQVVERYADGEPLRAVGIHEDIDERKRTENVLENARKRLKEIVDLVPDLLFVKNRRGEYLMANEAVSEAYGKPVGDILGKTDDELLVTEDNAEQFREDDLAVIESGERKVIPEEELVTADGETMVLETIKMPYEPAGTDEDAILGYSRNITQLKSYEEQLETQRDNLEVLNQVVRHDIRNDLQLILLYAEMLQDRVDGEEESYVEQVLTAGQDAIGITRTAGDVTDVLLQADAEREPKRLRAILEAEIESARSNYDHAQITIQSQIPDSEVLADDMLQSVFRNVLQNAIVHNDKDMPKVSVSAETQAGDVRIEIADNGPGIPDDQKIAIFEEETQGLDSQGSGLGLYLVKTLVDRYDGEVWVQDRDDASDISAYFDDDNGEGSVFVLELPTVS